MRQWLEDIVFWVLAIPLALGMCALYWIARLYGVRLEDDF